MKIIILSIYAFIMLRNTFSFPPSPTFYSLAQITRVLSFSFLNPLTTKDGSPSSHHLPLSFDGRWSTNPGAERQGTGPFVGCGRDHGWATDEVRSRMEESADTEARVRISVGDGHKPA